MYATAPQQRPINIKALGWSIGIHLLLLLLLFLFRYQVPDNKTSEAGGGLEVNLGTSEDGSGDNQPEKKENPAEYAATVVFNTPPDKSDLPKDMYSSDHPDATDISNPLKPKPGTTPNNTDSRQKPKETPRYVYQGGSGQGGNGAQQNTAGGSQGNTTGNGDRGVPGGTPGADNYTGTPGMGGIGHTLTGRNITPDRFEADFNESGKVVIRVTVDKEGNIVSRFVKSTSSPQLTRIAMEKLSKAKFSKSNGESPEQSGDVTIIFKTRQ
jgi:outer membrane biosynthesis protein TonB